MNRVRLFEKGRVVFEQEIGSGSFGRVYKATISESRLPVVAIKIFSEELLAENTLHKVYDELNKLASIEHENVVKLVGMVKERIPWLVFEYMKGGNLLQYVIRKKNPKEKQLIRYCRDICSGMAYLHRHQFLHRDLAARNILLHDKVAKIADLGLCSFLSEGLGTDYSVVGKMVAVRHAASECIVEAVYTPESDVWSFGVLMWEIWTGGQIPYGKDLKDPEIRRLIAEGLNPAVFFPPTCPPPIASIMEATLQVDRADRPTFQTLLMAFDEILDGQKIRLSWYQSNSPSNSPSFPISPPHAANTGLSGRLMSHSPTTNRLLTAIQQPNFSSTPDLKQAGTSPSKHTHMSSDARKMYGTRRGATSSRDLLEIPGEVNMERRYSEDAIDPANPAKKVGRPIPIQSSRLLSVSAQNLSNRLAKSQSDIHEEMMRELVPNRFQKHRAQHH